MIKKKFVPVLSSHSSKSSQSKKSSSTQKKPSDSSLENVYRLPSSLKRTEDMISKSILQRQLSSKILDIVGSTFRVKNATPSQGQYFCSPTNFSQFLKYKEYASSEFLETLYEVEGEDSFDNSLHSEAETNDEVSLLSIHTEQTRRAGEISMDKITNMFNTSFSQALERVGNQSVLLTDKDRKAYNTGLAMSLSTGRAKRRGSDPAKQVKQNLVGTRKMSYSLLGDVIGRKEDSMGMTVTVMKNQKAGTSKIGQGKKEVPVKQIDMRVKKSQEKESLSDKSLNKSIEVEISEEIKSVNASGSPKKVQGMKENKVKGSKGSSEPKFKTMPITQYDILKRSLDIKSQLLEPKRRMEIEIKRSVVSRKE